MDILAARKKAAERAKTQAAQRQPEQPKPAVVEPAHAEEVAPAPEAPAPESISAEPPVPEAATAVTTGSAEPDVVQSAEATAEAPAEEIELLSFRLGGEGYAVMIHDVREVLKNYQLTPVPNSSGHILGVMSLRGAVTTVMDPCKRLGLTPGVRDEKSRIIIVSTADDDMGLLVDRVTGVVRISPQDIRPAPENSEQGTEYILGIARKKDKLHILLDLARMTGA